MGLASEYIKINAKISNRKMGQKHVQVIDKRKNKYLKIVLPQGQKIQIKLAPTK